MTKKIFYYSGSNACQSIYTRKLFHFQLFLLQIYFVEGNLHLKDEAIYPLQINVLDIILKPNFESSINKIILITGTFTMITPKSEKSIAINEGRLTVEMNIWQIMKATYFTLPFKIKISSGIFKMSSLAHQKRRQEMTSPPLSDLNSVKQNFRN